VIQATTTHQEIQAILTLAEEVHRRLGGGWPEAVYRDALLFLGEERHIPCRPPEGVRGVGPVRATLVCFGTILVRVCRQFQEEPGLPVGMRQAGLDRAVLLRFAEAAIASQVVPVPCAGFRSDSEGATIAHRS